jgi:Protein of unknown function (DUF3467).
MALKKKAEDADHEVMSGSDIPHHRAADYRSIYANSARLRTSLYDFSFVLGEISADDDKLECEDRVQIVMSPQHAKVLLAILDRNVRAYEEKFGQLELPEGLS